MLIGIINGIIGIVVLPGALIALYFAVGVIIIEGDKEEERIAGLFMLIYFSLVLYISIAYLVT